MSSVKFILLVLISASIGYGWGAIIHEPLLEVDEPQPEMTTIRTDDTDTDSECVTNKGEQGKCMEFSQCFPIISQQYEYNKGNARNDSDTNTTKSRGETGNLEVEFFDGLYDEILTTSRSPLCPGELQVCCATTTPTSQFQSSSDEILLKDDNEDSKPSGNGNSSSGSGDASVPIFPSVCGQGLVHEMPIDAYHNQFTSSFNYNKFQKVTGGKQAKNGQFPWMVAIIGKNGKITCGATLITNNFILTASHCLSTYNANDIHYLKAHIGDFDLKSTRDGPHEVRKITKIILHKKFDIKNFYNDIALIKLDRPVQFSQDIQPICLPRPEYNALQLEKRDVIVTGWGRDSKWGLEAAVLRMVEMPVWNFQECQRVFNIFAPNRLLPSMNICAGDGKRNKDACIGDSGGPLQYKIGSRWTQLGIVSWGKGCGSFPGVYTAVQAHLPWIEKQIRTR